jgi:hypothetical protein
LLTYSVALFLKRQCDRTLAGVAPPEARRARALLGGSLRVRCAIGARAARDQLTHTDPHLRNDLGDAGAPSATGALHGFMKRAGGADYDGPDANAETVLRVLTGSARRAGDKVVARGGDLRSVFICFAGHGGSFPAVKRLSPLQYSKPCDLCGRPHTPRAPRDPREAAGGWVRWVAQDCNRTSSNQSAEDDELLHEDEDVLTPLGPARIVRCVRNGAAAVSFLPIYTGGITVSVAGLRLPSPFRRRRLPGGYNMLVAVEGRPRAHKHLYDVELRPGAKPLVSPADLHGGSGGWRAVLALQLISTLSGGGGAELPIGALPNMLQVGGGLGTAPELLRLLGRLLRRPGRLLVGLRREMLCLAVGPRREQHYHSSLTTREWAFGMPHPTTNVRPTAHLSALIPLPLHSLRRAVCW